jgi:gamma-glutamylcyclotransferase
MRYFAYGSNLCPARFSQRIRAACAEGRGVLKGYALRFDKIGRDGSAKCNIARTDDPTYAVIGVMYHLTPRRQCELDRIEGLGRDYDRLPVSIERQGRPYHAYTYIARPGVTNEKLLPFDWYLAYVVAGARHFRFPAGYIHSLRKVACVTDPDTKRAASNRRQLAFSLER